VDLKTESGGSGNDLKPMFWRKHHQKVNVIQDREWFFKLLEAVQSVQFFLMLSLQIPNSIHLHQAKIPSLMDLFQFSPRSGIKRTPTKLLMGNPE
jgi:hypothetical protein